MILHLAFQMDFKLFEQDNNYFVDVPFGSGNLVVDNFYCFVSYFTSD